MNFLAEAFQNIISLLMLILPFYIYKSKGITISYNILSWELCQLH